MSRGIKLCYQIADILFDPRPRRLVEGGVKAIRLRVSVVPHLPDNIIQFLRVWNGVSVSVISRIICDTWSSICSLIRSRVVVLRGVGLLGTGQLLGNLVLRGKNGLEVVVQGGS
jgi:hypothetical protein